MLYRSNVVTLEAIQDILNAIVKATGLAVKVALQKYSPSGEYFMRFQQEQASEERSLSAFLTKAIDRQEWHQLEAATIAERSSRPDEPFIRDMYHHLLASAVAPIVKESQTIGEISTEFAIVKDTFDWQEHLRYARQYRLSWPGYQVAIESTRYVTIDQLAGTARLLGIAAQALADLPIEAAIANAQTTEQQPVGALHTYWKEITHRAIAFMHENLENPIGVAEVSQAVALTPAYFSMLFSEQVGCSPCDYLIELRLERAKQYLTHTRMPVKEVGVALGYSRSYFSRLFKREVGCTPQQYAQRMRVCQRASR